MEIQEAYEVLSKPSARQRYDQERHISGLDRQEAVSVVTPSGLLRQAQKLADDVRRMTAYRVDIPWLQSALIYLLSNHYLAILQPPDLKSLRVAFLKEIISCVRILPYPFPESILQSVAQLVADDETENKEWHDFLNVEKRKYLFRKALPWLVAMITIILCGIMYWYGKR